MNFVEAFLKESKLQNDRGRCLHYAKGNRCEKIISAHSIQNRGQLRLIAESGHVYRLSNDITTLRKFQGKPQLREIGVNKVSAFPGFCQLHDNDLFEPIDNFFLEPNKKQIALYAYRCLCREYFVKENASIVMDKMKCHPGLDDGQRELLMASSQGHNLGFLGLKYHKTMYDTDFSKLVYDDFEYTCFTSTSPFNFQLSGILYPDFDFNGMFLQDLRERRKPLKLITFFTAPMENGWAFCFAWHRSSNETCIPFIRSLASQVSNNSRLEDLILRFSLSCCENHAIRISWWNGRTECEKRQMLERMHLMTNLEVPTPSNYLMVGCEGIADWEFQYVRSSF